jgi:hypothetical protein
MKTENILTKELAVSALGIVALMIIELVALMKGVDGIMFGACATGIGAIIGYTMKGFSKLCK